MAAPLRLPPPLQRFAEAYAARLLTPPGAPLVDFAAPVGAPALVGSDSVSWRVFKNPVTMFIGGVTAVLLELAEPRVRHGVWDHSDFRMSPLLRLQRTGLAAIVTVYAPADQARAMIAGVTRLHARVSGATPAGEPYHALDPDLLTWVQATAAYGFLEAYHRFAHPLSAAARYAYWREGKPLAALYGTTISPETERQWAALLAATSPRLAPSPILSEFLAIMNGLPALPRPARPVQRLLIKAAVDALPPGIAARLNLGRDWRLHAWERRAVRLMATTADRLVLNTWPAVQACRRLRLAPDYLVRSH